jgi:hypothetical protein
MICLENNPPILEYVVQLNFLELHSQLRDQRLNETLFVSLATRRHFSSWHFATLRQSSASRP